MPVSFIPPFSSLELLLCGCLGIVETRQGICFGPQPHLARLEGIVLRLYYRLAVQKAAYGISLNLHPQLLPFPGQHPG